MMEDTKLVYAFNLLTGEYKGPKTLDNTDRSPISGAWQIPCNMVEVAPPEIPEDHKCLWDGTQWILKEVEKTKEDIDKVLDDMGWMIDDNGACVGKKVSE